MPEYDFHDILIDSFVRVSEGSYGHLTSINNILVSN